MLSSYRRRWRRRSGCTVKLGTYVAEILRTSVAQMLSCMLNTYLHLVDGFMSSLQKNFSNNGSHHHYHRLVVLN
ncbi:hypothetical protein AHAS_Ahas16G0256500 [Arachis hypogaea]